MIKMIAKEFSNYPGLMWYNYPLKFFADYIISS
jgi:hypothetical protein